MAHAIAKNKPLQELQVIPNTPGRTAFFFACAGLLTFGLISPIALVMSVLALIKRPDGFGVVALLMSGSAVVILADIFFLGGVLILFALGLLMGA